MITRAYFKTHKVVHYAVIFTFWYSRKSFYHYTECINNPASRAPPKLPAGTRPPASPLGAYLPDPFRRHEHDHLDPALHDSAEIMDRRRAYILMAVAMV